MKLKELIRKILCDGLGWHNGNGATPKQLGINLHSVCSRCKKKVMQDSQGNWF